MENNCCSFYEQFRESRFPDMAITPLQTLNVPIQTAGSNTTPLQIDSENTNPYVQTLYTFI